jgi:hypothetical protein
VEGRYSFSIKSDLELSPEVVSGIGRGVHENDFKFDVELKEDDREVIFLVLFADFFGVACGSFSSPSASAVVAPSASCSAVGATVTVLLVVVNTGRLLVPLTRFHIS